MEKTEGRVDVDVGNSVGWITLNNVTRHNAMSLSMWRGLGAAVDALQSDPAVRVVVLRGAGTKAFVSGADISEFESKRNSREANKEYDAAGHQAMSRLASLDKPTIAMLNGYCIGGGMAIALCCDLRLAADTLIYGIPAVRLGIGYGWQGIRRLTEVVGTSSAREILLTGRRFDAGHALRVGFAHQVVPESQLEQLVAEECATLSRNAPLTLRAMKITLEELGGASAGRDMTRSEQAAAAATNSADFVEGRRAFMEKRAPRFVGR